MRQVGVRTLHTKPTQHWTYLTMICMPHNWLQILLLKIPQESVQVCWRAFSDAHQKFVSTHTHTHTHAHAHTHTHTHTHTRAHTHTHTPQNKLHPRTCCTSESWHLNLLLHKLQTTVHVFTWTSQLSVTWETASVRLALHFALISIKYQLIIDGNIFVAYITENTVILFLFRLLLTQKVIWTTVLMITGNHGNFTSYKLFLSLLSSCCHSSFSASSSSQIPALYSHTALKINIIISEHNASPILSLLKSNLTCSTDQ
jgi:hypothetical protein